MTTEHLGLKRVAEGRSALKVCIRGDHPHADEYGRIVVTERDTIPILDGLTGPMYTVELDTCPHGVASCYVPLENLRLIRNGQELHPHFTKENVDAG